MPWYRGPTLLDHLETVDVDRGETQPFRLAVQWISRDGADFRGYAGTVLGGSIRPGDEIVVQPSGAGSRVARIVTSGRRSRQATAGQAVTLTLTDAIDVARGDVVATADRPPHVADQFACHLVWMRRRTDAAGPALPVAARHGDADGDRNRTEAPDRCRDRRPRGDEAAGAERNRLRQCRSRPASTLRCLRRKQRHRQASS